jgi:serine/threonine protein kinase/tetratricopeptide (TPR) repeat protein
MSEETIFVTALEKISPVERAAYVEGACAGDPELRRRVEALLRAHDQSGDLLDPPVQGAGPSTHHATAPVSSPTAHRSSTRPIVEGPGTRIGPYRLLRSIGEGGMGVVFLAEQEIPVRRPVALKVIKPGMDTALVVARFEAERQALALMDHNHIAKVLDAGTTDSGRPFFVMELVSGVPITEYCDQNRLTAKERLELFVPVCRAIQHAHQKGIIHRDIKPSNVLVTLHDGKPMPKVIDFGVAKAIDQRLTERTLFTQFGMIVGTPEYMSPEQAQLSGWDIDTRSDIYSLGVLLYELLTGSTPLERQRLREAAFTEVLRRIREEEPPKPSTRLLTTEETASVAARRGTEPAKLAKLVRGDLDWIVMKALEKDRTRRYESANGLARDIERYLHDEPVEAGPPSAGYRLRKLARKHRGALAAVATVATLLATEAAVSTWQAFLARAAERRALLAQRGEAEQRKDAEAVLRFVQDHIFAAARPVDRPGGLGPGVTLRQALDAALPVVERSFAAQPLVEARLRMTLGMSYSYLGEDRIAADQFRRARTLFTDRLGPDHPDTLESMYHLANAYAALGDQSEAYQLREETLARRTARLGPEHVDTLRSRMMLASSYAILNRFDDAVELDEQTVRLMEAKLGLERPETLLAMDNLANNYRHVRRFDDAVALLEKTLAIRQRTLGRDHLETLSGMNRLAFAYNDVKQHVKALALREETLALQKLKLPADHPDLWTTMYALANDYGFLKRYPEALKLHREVLELRKAKFGPDHPSVLWSTWGVTYQLFQLGHGAEALPMVEEVVERAVRLKVQPDLIGLLNRQRTYFQQANDVAGCRRTAELWEKLRRTDARSLYNAACYRAVTAAVLRAKDKSPAAAQEARIEADRAMTWLRQAIAAGYNNVALMKTDSDLDALRDRADFQELLAELKTKQEDQERRWGH